MIEFTAEIYCRVPGENLSYRLYVDNDLITERTWNWDEKRFFIREHVLLNIDRGEHKVSVTVPGSLSLNRFELGQLTIDGTAVDHQNGVFQFVQ